MNLLHFPDEILLQIFRSINDIDLLNAAQVCTRFERISKEIVAEKYDGNSKENYFEMYLYSNADSDLQPLSRDFVDKFSNQITALNIYVAHSWDPAKLLINCRSAKHVYVHSLSSPFPVTTMMQSMPRLTSLKMFLFHCSDSNWAQQLPLLESLDMKSVYKIDVEMFKCFLYLNPQLKHLRMDCSVFSLETFRSLTDHLNGLKSLDYTGSSAIEQEWPDIRMANLETLKLTMYVTSIATVLRAFGSGSKMIRNLEISCYGGEAQQALSAFEDVIGLFHELTSFKLARLEVSMDLIGIFVRNLPNLITLHLDRVELNEISTDNVFYMFRKCECLKELKLKSRTKSTNPFSQFNLSFHRRFANVTRNRGSNIKFQIIQPERHILITEEKITENGRLLYWTGYDASLSRSDVHLFDLGNRVLERIYSYLDDQSHRVLYETCTTTKKAMEERIKSQWFTVSDEETARDILSRFGDHITKLDIDMKTDDHTQMTETWKLIREKCSNQLTEMKTNNVRVDATGAVVVKFPNLLNLKVSSMIPNNVNVFPLMECPKLTQLEFDGGDITLPEQTIEFGISMKNLTKIRASFNESTHKVFGCLDQNYCHQIQEFTVVQGYEYEVQVVNIAMRFRNLVILNLVSTSLQNTRMERLFQNCTKLKKLTLECHEDYHDLEFWQRIVRCIKENCRHLEVIQLLVSNFRYDRAYSREITNSLPKVQVKIVVRNGSQFLVGALNQPIFDRQKPY